MNNTTIVIIGIAALVLGLWWWKQIQNSRKNDADFERRDAAKEEIGDDEPIL